MYKYLLLAHLSIRPKLQKFLGKVYKISSEIYNLLDIYYWF